MLREYYQNERKRHSLVGFGIRAFSEVRKIYGDTQMEEGLRMIGEFLGQRCDGMNVFYLGTGHFIIQSERGLFDEEQMIRDLKERFSRHWKNDKADLVLSIGTLRCSRTRRRHPAASATPFLWLKE